MHKPSSNFPICLKQYAFDIFEDACDIWRRRFNPSELNLTLRSYTTTHGRVRVLSTQVLSN